MLNDEDKVNLYNQYQALLENIKENFTYDGIKNYTSEKELNSTDLKNPSDPEEFTKVYLIDPLFKLIAIQRFERKIHNVNK